MRLWGRYALLWLCKYGNADRWCLGCALLLGVVLYYIARIAW